MTQLDIILHQIDELEKDYDLDTSPDVLNALDKVKQFIINPPVEYYPSTDEEDDIEYADNHSSIGMMLEDNRAYNPFDYEYLMLHDIGDK